MRARTASTVNTAPKKAAGAASAREPEGIRTTRKANEFKEHFVKKLFASFVSAALCVSLALATFGAGNDYKVTYDGGSVSDVKTGTGMKLVIEANQIRLIKDKSEVLVVPASAVTEISYG